LTCDFRAENGKRKFRAKTRVIESVASFPLRDGSAGIVLKGERRGRQGFAKDAKGGVAVFRVLTCATMCSVIAEMCFRVKLRDLLSEYGSRFARMPTSQNRDMGHPGSGQVLHSAALGSG
jgi:hypothetical protein